MTLWFTFVGSIFFFKYFECLSQMCLWTSIAMVVPQSTLGTALALTLSISVAGNGVCNSVIGWILGTSSGYEATSQEDSCFVCKIYKPSTFSCSGAEIPLWRWQRMLIFLLANAGGCTITSVLLNVADYRQVRDSTDSLRPMLVNSHKGHQWYCFYPSIHPSILNARFFLTTKYYTHSNTGR